MVVLMTQLHGAVEGESEAGAMMGVGRRYSDGVGMGLCGEVICERLRDSKTEFTSVIIRLHLNLAGDSGAVGSDVLFCGWSVQCGEWGDQRAGYMDGERRGQEDTEAGNPMHAPESREQGTHQMLIQIGRCKAYKWAARV